RHVAGMSGSSNRMRPLSILGSRAKPTQRRRSNQHAIAAHVHTAMAARAPIHAPDFAAVAFAQSSARCTADGSAGFAAVAMNKRVCAGDFSAGCVLCAVDALCDAAAPDVATGDGADLAGSSRSV